MATNREAEQLFNRAQTHMREVRAQEQAQGERAAAIHAAAQNDSNLSVSQKMLAGYTENVNFYDNVNGPLLLDNGDMSVTVRSGDGKPFAQTETFWLDVDTNRDGKTDYIKVITPEGTRYLQPDGETRLQQNVSINGQNTRMDVLDSPYSFDFDGLRSSAVRGQIENGVRIAPFEVAAFGMPIRSARTQQADEPTLGAAMSQQADARAKSDGAIDRQEQALLDALKDEELQTRYQGDDAAIANPNDTKVSRQRDAQGKTSQASVQWNVDGGSYELTADRRGNVTTRDIATGESTTIRNPSLAASLIATVDGTIEAKGQQAEGVISVGEDRVLTALINVATQEIPDQHIIDVPEPDRDTPAPRIQDQPTPEQRTESAPDMGQKTTHQARAYGGVSRDAMPPIDADKVAAFQEKLGAAFGTDDLKTPQSANGADGKWGPKTQRMFEEACAIANVDPRTVDLNNPDDPETKLVMAKLEERGTTRRAFTPIQQEPITLDPVEPLQPIAPPIADVVLDAPAPPVPTITPGISLQEPELELVTGHKSAPHYRPRQQEEQRTPSASETRERLETADSMLIYGSDWGVYKQAAGIPLEEGERGFGGGHSLSYEQRIALGEAELAAESRGSTLLEMAQRGKAYNQDTGRFENSAAAQQSANQWLENTLSQLGFPVEADGVISREERQMVREAEKAAGLERSNGMISHKELDRLHAADTAARKDGGETLYSKAEKGEVYNPTIDGFSPTNVPDARAAGGRAQGGMSV